MLGKNPTVDTATVWEQMGVPAWEVEEGILDGRWGITCDKGDSSFQGHLLTVSLFSIFSKMGGNSSFILSKVSWNEGGGLLVAVFSDQDFGFSPVAVVFCGSDVGGLR